MRVLRKTYYTLFLKKCLWSCPGLSMYLSERMNWIISSFPHRISKILFVLGSWYHFGSMGYRFGECPFFCCLTIWKNTVKGNELAGQPPCVCGLSNHKANGITDMIPNNFSTLVFETWWISFGVFCTNFEKY